MAEDSFIQSVVLEQPFLILLVLCAMAFDITFIITFIISLFYDLGAFDVIGEIINLLAPWILGGILLLMGAVKYGFTKIEGVLAPVDKGLDSRKEYFNKNKAGLETDEVAGSGDTKDWKLNEKTGAYELNKPGGSGDMKDWKLNKEAGAYELDKSRKPAKVEGSGKGDMTQSAKAAGKQAAMEVAKGGLKAGKELAQGETAEAAKTTAKTGLKVGWIILWLAVSWLLEAIPYSEVIPWYTIWAFYVWFKVSYQQLKMITQ